jgi:stringent starvation protein B
MIILNFFLALLLGLASATANTYFTTKYGGDSNMLIIPVVLMALAIVLAANGGEMHGRKQQQRDMAEAMNKQQEVIVAQMNEFNAKLRAKDSAEGR